MTIEWNEDVLITQIPVTTTAAEHVLDAGTKRFRIKNAGPQLAYIGPDNTVTSTNGFGMQTFGDIEDFEVERGQTPGSIWHVTATGAATLIVIEERR